MTECEVAESISPDMPRGTPRPGVGLRMLASMLRVLNRVLRRGRRTDGAPARILLVRQGMLGDVIQSTALLADLRQAFPNASIAYMTGSGGRMVLEGNADADEVVEYLGLLPVSPRAFARWLRRVMELRRRRFDLGLCLNPDSWDALLLGLLGVRRTVGFVEPGREFLLDHTLVWDEAEIRPRQARFDDLLRTLGIEPRCRRYVLSLPSRAEGAVAEVVRQTAEAGRPLFVVAPGGARNPTGCAPYRQWLADRWVEVVSSVTCGLSASTVLAGDQDDAPLSQEILAALPVEQKQFVTDLTGLTTVPELGLLLSSADMLVTNDSAPVWIAAAVGCPAVAVFGCNHPTINVPLTDWYAAVSCDLPCHPCYRGDAVPTCSIPPPCVTAVTVAKVMEAVREVLRQRLAGRVRPGWPVYRRSGWPARDGCSCPE